MYYTKEHEWIEYNGYNAFVGICKAKLSGPNEIHSAAFCNVLSNLERGAVVATFYYERSSFNIYMPVDGKVIDINRKLLEKPSLLLNDEAERTWILKIIPAAPYKRDDLLQLHQYKSLKKKGQGTIHG
jgi:glycine cleavage system H protein